MASQCSSAGSAERYRLRDKRILPRWQLRQRTRIPSACLLGLGHHPSDEHHVCSRHASEHFRTRGAPARAKPRLTDIWQEILETLNHKSWLVLFFAGVVFSIYVGLTTGLGIYFNRFFWDWTPSDVAIFALADLSAALVISVFAGVLAKGWDKKRLATWLFIVSIIVGPVLLLGRLSDMYPAPR